MISYNEMYVCLLVKCDLCLIKTELLSSVRFVVSD